MALYYHGRAQRGPYFEGWYLKYQTREGQALALIPACHVGADGRRDASLQVLAEGRSWWLEYPGAAFHASEPVFHVQLGQSLFTERETRLHVEREGLSLHGTVRHGPFTPLRFTGCICAVLDGGKEYRLATYRGARAERWSASGVSIRQGRYRLTADLLEGKGCPLRAPAGGMMARTVHERLCATVWYRFWAGETLLLDRTDPCAGFEYAET